MEDLSVTLIQSNIHWQSIEANLAMFEEKLWSSTPAADLIVLPEMFTTGFTMNAKEMAEPMNGKTFRWMRQMAHQFQAVITGSYIVYEKNSYFNRLIWMEPGGNYKFYDKRHLFRISGENAHFSPGSSYFTAEIRGWKIRPFICYDLRFPVWTRNKVEKDTGKPGYDLVIYSANWPASRMNAWDTLLRARAIENAAYCIGVNRTGKDEEGINYTGHSCVYDFRGEHMIPVSDSEIIQQAVLSMNDLRLFREKFPVHLDADDYNLVS
jgi:omega-amidase